MKKILLAGIFYAISTTLLSQYILTIGEVFDFNVNDEFHIQDLAGLPRAHKINVLEKTYSAQKDTVFYKMFYEYYYSEYNMKTNQLDYYFNSSNEELYYTNLDSSIFTFHYLTEAPQDSTHYFKFDSLIYNDTKLCNRLINGFRRVDGDFEPNTNQIEYGEGLGKTYHYTVDGSSGSGGMPDWEYKLVYYIKNGFECGTPDGRLNSLEYKSGENQVFCVFPTVVQEQITIKASNSGNSYNICIVDLSGKITFEAVNLNGEELLNDENLVRGLHMVVISSGRNVYTTKIIKE